MTDLEKSGQPPREGEVLDPQDFQIRGEVQQFDYRSSPYPAPPELRQYEEILPGFTDRILSLTERESEHRISDEQLQTKATIDLAKRGQTYALVVVLALIAVGGAGVATGRSVLGLGAVIAAAATVVTAFVAPNLFRRLRRGGTGGAGDESSGDKPELPAG